MVVWRPDPEGSPSPQGEQKRRTAAYEYLKEHNARLVDGIDPDKLMESDYMKHVWLVEAGETPRAVIMIPKKGVVYEHEIIDTFQAVMADMSPEEAAECLQEFITYLINNGLFGEDAKGLFLKLIMDEYMLDRAFLDSLHDQMMSFALEHGLDIPSSSGFMDEVKERKGDPKLTMPDFMEITRIQNELAFQQDQTIAILLLTFFAKEENIRAFLQDSENLSQTSKDLPQIIKQLKIAILGDDNLTFDNYDEEPLTPEATNKLKAYLIRDELDPFFAELFMFSGRGSTGVSMKNRLEIDEFCKRRKHWKEMGQ